MDKIVECFSCHEVEAVKYFELLDMRWSDMNAVTQRVKSFLKVADCSPATLLNPSRPVHFRKL